MSAFTKEQLIEWAKGREANAALYPQFTVKDLELVKISLASLEAEEPRRNPVLAYADSYRDMAKQGVRSIPVWSVITDLERNIAPLFTAHPASAVNAEPVSFDALRDAVAEVSGTPAMEWSDIYKGHQAVPFINFNSLARIVDKFRPAPPAPLSVPDESAVELLATDLMKRIDKITGERHSVATLSTLRVSIVEAFRAAMLQGAEPVTTNNRLPEEAGLSLQSRNLIRQRHAEWSQATFGDVGPIGPLKHLSKEALEAAAEPNDLSEWADMQFLLWDAQRRAGICDGEITAAMEEKLKVNMSRHWPDPMDGEPRYHVKGK